VTDTRNAEVGGGASGEDADGDIPFSPPENIKHPENSERPASEQSSLPSPAASLNASPAESPTRIQKPDDSAGKVPVLDSMSRGLLPVNVKLFDQPDMMTSVAVETKKRKLLLQLNAAVTQAECDLARHTKEAFLEERRDAYQHVSCLIDRTSTLTQILQLKLQAYAQRDSCAQVTVLIVSSIITLAAAVQPEVGNLVPNATIGSGSITTLDINSSFFTLFILLAGSSLAILAGFQRIRGWKGKTSDMLSVYNSALYTAEMLDMYREEIRLSRNHKQLNQVCSEFIKVFTLFQKSMSRLRSSLPVNQQIHFSKEWFRKNVRSIALRKQYENAVKITESGRTLDKKTIRNMFSV